MKRKAIQLANNTLVLSLPAKWVHSNGVVKGDELEVENSNNNLIISSGINKASIKSKTKIDISGMSVSLVWNYMNSVYRAGFDEIEIFFNDVIKKNNKTDKDKKTIELISNITDKLVGMEIIRQTKNTCTLKQITKIDSESYENVLNRTYLSISNIAEDLMLAIKEGDFDTIESLHKYSEVNVNKLSDYSLKILNSGIIQDPQLSNLKYLITFLLEEIGDDYADIARLIQSENKIPNKDLLKLINKTNELLEYNYKLFLKYDKNKLIEYHSKRGKIKKELFAHVKNNNKDIEIVILLKSILAKLMEVNNCLTTIDISNKT